MSEDIDYIVTSHSIDGTFESCPRRFEFRHVYSEFPMMEGMGLAAEVGTALHEAAQDWTANHDRDRSDYVFARNWPWKIEELRQRKGLPADSKRTLGNGLLLLDAIRDHEFWDEWQVARLPDGSPAIELAWRINHTSLGSFAHPVSGKQVFLATQGKIDWILQSKSNPSKFRVADLKTTILDSNAHDASFRFSGQAGQYGLVLSQAIGHDWMDKGMEVTYIVAEFSEFGAPDVVPHTYELDPGEILESIEAKNERLTRMISMGQKGFWPRRSHGCQFYGTPCGFLDVCHRRDPAFLSQWFQFERDRFRIESRIYEPYWTLEA